MRKTRTVFAAMAAIAALSLTACGGTDEGDAGASGGGDDGIRIGIKFDQPGLGFKEGNKYTGFDVDVAKYIAGELGYDKSDITFVESPSANRENMLSTGQVDMIVATYSITDERKQQVDFAGPYFIAGQDLLVPKDSNIQGPKDLDKKNLCSVTGSTSAKNVQDAVPGVNLLEQPGYAECVTAMAGGQIDAVTTDDIILAGLAAQPSNQGKFKVVGNTFSEERYGVGIPNGSDLCKPINDAIVKMIDSGKWKQFLSDNLEGVNFEPNKKLNPPTPDKCA